MEGTVIRRIIPFSLKLPWQKAELTQEEINRREIIGRMNETKQRLEAVRSKFDAVTDFDLIDVYINEMAAVEKQYSILFKEAKKLL